MKQNLLVFVIPRNHFEDKKNGEGRMADSNTTLQLALFLNCNIF